jgi:hypothetical protein
MYWPIAMVWLGLSQVLGTIVSKVLLAIVLSPVGILCQIIGKDSLRIDASSC